MSTQEKPLIIAEVKLWSPRGVRLTENSFERQFELACMFGDIISIHTHPIWKGKYEHVTWAKRKTDKPILAFVKLVICIYGMMFTRMPMRLWLEATWKSLLHQWE